MTDAPVLHGTQCTLRLAIDDDAPRFVEILSTPEVAEWWPAHDEARVRGELIGGTATTAFAIEVDETVVGCILFVEEPNPDYRHASIDVFVDPGWHGKGIGTDSIRTVARHLVHDRGHHRLAIDPAAGNVQAIRTYERVGFKRVGILREYERASDGTWHDCVAMDLLRRDLT